MKMRRFAAGLCAAFALPAFALEAPGAERRTDRIEFHFDAGTLLADAHGAQKSAEEWRSYGEHMRSWAHSFTDQMHGSMASMFSDRVGRGKVVKGAPYSADVVTETNQALADGNVITHKSMNRFYRDGEGRTRQETYRGDTLRSVYISDPVAGTSYTLLPGSKTAMSVPRVDRAAPRAAPGKTSGDGASPETERKIIVRTLDSRDDASRGREEVHVQVVRTGGKDAPPPPAPPVAPLPPIPSMPGLSALPTLPPLPPIPGVHTMRFESTASLGQGISTKLGVKDFDGVKAEGTSTVWTIPAGQIGNRNAILVTKEAWYSPELQVMVYTRHNDPRTGESVYRLASIKRAEPSGDLFKVPEGYSLKGRAPRGAAPEAGAGNSPG